MNDISLFIAPNRRFRYPLSRDQAILLMVAFNEIMLGVDTLLAHGLNGSFSSGELIPIIFGPLAGLLLIVAGLFARRHRVAASRLATAVFIISILVGVLGAYFHWVRGTLPAAPEGYQVTIGLLIWAPPIFAPLAFAGIGVLGLSAAWLENPPGSGLLELPAGRRLQMPFSQTRAYFFLVSLGVLAATLSSVLDHARLSYYENVYAWIPLVAGIFGTIIAFLLGVVNRPLTRTDVGVFAGAMIWLIIIGVMGLILHVQADLTSQSVIVPERFLRGAPPLAPLLFANMGLVGLLILLPPDTSRLNYISSNE